MNKNEDRFLSEKSCLDFGKIKGKCKRKIIKTKKEVKENKKRKIKILFLYFKIPISFFFSLLYEDKIIYLVNK